MITRCNQCGTKFEISAELVQSDDPTVRCGECLTVFDARAQLVSGDSIHNYSSVSAGRQAGRQHTRRASAASVAPPMAESSPAMAGAGAADQYAHISDDDLERADTVVLDQSLSDSSIPAPAYRPPSAGTHINDGFYSPDLDIDLKDHQRFDATPGVPAAAGTKIDPSINLNESLDSTSLEFERTLALENFSPQAEADARRLIVERNQRITDNPDPGLLADSHVVEATGFSQNQAQQSARAQHASSKRQSATNETSDRGSKRASAAEAVSRPAQNAGDVLAQDAEAFEWRKPSSDPDRHLTPEERGIQRGFDSSDPQQSDVRQELTDDHNSASDLRRYVSTRGSVVAVNESQQQRKSRQSSSMLKPLLVVFVLTAAALYFARDTVATMNLPAPVLSTFCGVTGCELPLQKDVEQLDLIRHQMSSHNSLDNVLLFTVDLINRASFPQPYPVLVVTMADSSGESVAFRKFQPGEYLEEDPALIRMPAGSPIRIEFEIVDPGPEALSSELSFE